MASSELVMAMLRGYASKARLVTIKFASFTQFVRSYAEGHQHQQGALKDFLGDTAASLLPVLKELADGGKCTLEYDGESVKAIVLLGYLRDRIRAVYKQIDDNPEIPFPTEESLGLALPQSITTINIKTDFVKWLDEDAPESEILRLSFPEDIVSIIVTSDMLGRKLLEHSVLKIRSYLSSGRNAAYTQQKLREAFTALKDQVVQSTIHDIIGKPSQAVETLMNPSEFSFGFWAHLVSNILKEFKTKTEKTPQDHGYCHASYLIGLYNVYHKGLLRREQEVEVALKEIDTLIAAEPFYFSVTDIYNFRDDKGVALTKVCPKDRLDRYLEGKTHSENEGLLPEILRIHTADNREYFIAKRVLLRLTLNKVFAAAREYKKVYESEWFSALSEFRKEPAMLKDEAFEQDLAERIAKEDPLLKALLKFDLLYLVRKEMVIEDEIAKRIDRILDVKRRALIPLNDLLGLSRRELVTNARLKLPVWKTIPVLNHLLSFLDRVLGGRGGAEVRARPSRSEARAIDDGEAPAVPSIPEFGDLSGVEEAPVHGARAPAHASGVAPASSKVHESGLMSLGPEGAAANAGRRPAASSANGGLHSLSEGEAGAASANKARLAAYRKAIDGLKEQLIGKEVSIDKRLRELADRWNPLVAEKPRRDLEEDVNSFVRDQVRQIRRSLLTKPPDLPRVKNLSVQISQAPVFAQIKRKDEFREYVQLYLVKTLGKV